MSGELRRKLVPVACTAIVVLGIGLAGCGSSDTPDDNSSSPASESPAPEPVPSGPEGSLTATSFGSVEQGMETSEVVDLWGKPDTRKRFPGCELNPGAPGVISLTWNSPDGEVILSFNAETERLDSYRTSSKKYPTRSGVRVGDDFAVLKDSEGSALKPVILGTATPTSESGIWQTGDPAGSSQLFDIAGGKITSITGGEIQFCE